MVSRVCDEFGCVPSVAERELDQHAELVFDILEYRAFARASEAWRAAARRTDDAAVQDRARLLNDRWVKRVVEAEFAEARGEDDA